MKFDPADRRFIGSSGWRSMHRGILAIALMVCGCGRDNLSHVQGKISYQGVPVSHGIINFIGPDNLPHGSSIAADGSYAFALPPGTYDVIIAAPAVVPEGWAEGDPPPETKPEVPEKYNLRQTSGLKKTVSEPDQTIDFELQ